MKLFEAKWHYEHSMPNDHIRVPILSTKIIVIYCTLNVYVK